MSDLQPLSIGPLILGERTGRRRPRLRDWSKPDKPFGLWPINNAWRGTNRTGGITSFTQETFRPQEMPDSPRAAGPIHPQPRKLRSGPEQLWRVRLRGGGEPWLSRPGTGLSPCSGPIFSAYYACDMTYSGNVTHFYGQGTADPLRPDVTLQSLEAKIHPPHGAGGQAGLRLHQSVDGAEQPAFVSESWTARTWQARARIPDRRRRGGSGAQRGGLAWLSDRGWRILASHAPF